jgi:phosphoribosylaminoimidazole-succinocarboxamide synthase
VTKIAVQAKEGTMLDKDLLNRIRLTRRAGETLVNARTKFGAVGGFDRHVKRMESAIRAAMALCRQLGGAEGYRELIRLEVLLGEIRGEPAARLH